MGVPLRGLWASGGTRRAEGTSSQQLFVFLSKAHHSSLGPVAVRVAAPRLLHGVVQLLPLPLLPALRKLLGGMFLPEGATHRHQYMNLCRSPVFGASAWFPHSFCVAFGRHPAPSAARGCHDFAGALGPEPEDAAFERAAPGRRGEVLGRPASGPGLLGHGA